MKIRTDFVTNSSSSSFVYFTLSSDELKRTLGNFEQYLDDGESCFFDSFYANNDFLDLTTEVALEGMFSELERIMDKKKHSELLDMRQTLLEDESLDITVQAGIYSFGADATGGDESLEQLAVDGRKYGHTWHNGTLEEFEQTPAWDE